MDIPFQLHPKTAFAQLIDILFSLLQCLSVTEELGIRDGDDNTVMTNLKTMVFPLIARLDNWWSRCQSMIDPVEARADEWMGTDETNTRRKSDDPNHFPLLRHSDMPTAALGSVYDSANVITLRLLFLVSPSAPLYEERVQRHVQSILSAKEFMAAIPSPASGRGSLMVEFPLVVITIWAPSCQSQREMAYNSGALFTHVACFIHRRMSISTGRS